MQKQSIGNFLATLRRAKGMTQQEVADRLGISNRTLSAWETDKAYPDILLLPVLADLYGVTADEIVRGERRSQTEQSPQEQTELSEKSLTRVLKNRYGQFLTQACTLTAALCASAVVVFFGALFLYHVAGLIFCIIGCAAFIVCAGLFIAFIVGAYNAAEGETQASANYRLCVAHTVFIAYSVCALCLLLLGVSLFLIACSYGEGAAGRLSLSLIVAALAFFVGGVLANASALNKYGSDKQKEAKQRNAKRYSKTALFGLIPLVVGLVLIFGCSVWTPQTSETLFSGDASGLTAYAETLVVEQDSYLCLECGVPAGEYPLDISGKISRGEYLNDGNRIMIEYTFGEATLRAWTEENDGWLDLYYVDGETERLMCTTNLVTVEDASFYPVRTEEFVNEFEKYIIVNEGTSHMANVFIETNSWEAYGVRDGVYLCELVTFYDIRGLCVIAGGLVILIDLIVCISVCAAKREKIRPKI